MTKGASISQELRIAILALHSIVQMEWNEISTHLKVHPESVRQIVQCSKARVGDDFFTLLYDIGHDERAHPRSPSPKYPKGSEESEKLLKVALKPENFGKNPIQLACFANLDIASSITYKYIHEHHDLAEYKAHRKPKLKNYIFTDETWIEIGTPRGKPNVWRPVGSDPYDFGIPTIQDQISL
ncbi:hypothetical protein HOY80DRAFT_1030117 [Tuber brumale]|nr:hypothetical protein HOY80DRAFT_1030117 [Tuber brumale]